MLAFKKRAFYCREVSFSVYKASFKIALFPQLINDVFRENDKRNIWNVLNLLSFLYPPQRGYISFVNTFVTPRNNDLGPYVPWRHLISAKF